MDDKVTIFTVTVEIDFFMSGNRHFDEEKFIEWFSSKTGKNKEDFSVTNLLTFTGPKEIVCQQQKAPH